MVGHPTIGFQTTNDHRRMTTYGSCKFMNAFQCKIIAINESVVLRFIPKPAQRLGVCLGLQLLFEGSDEDGADTLGVLAGRTVRLEDAPTLPHIGWNQVDRGRPHPLFAGIDDGADFYFVHSYVGVPTDDAVIAATTEHGRPFVSAVARGQLLGVQFHPERSGDDGLRLLANFTGLVAASASAA